MVLLIPPSDDLEGDHKGHCLGCYIDSVVVVVQQNLSCIHTRRSFRKSILAVFYTYSNTMGKREREDELDAPNQTSRATRKTARLSDSANSRPDLRRSKKNWDLYLNHQNTGLNIASCLKNVRKMGFDGVLLSEPVMGDLENTINSVFAPDNWPLEDFTSNPNSDLWVALKPALRLASHMLTSKAALAFFRRLRFGVETVNEETHETYLDYEDPSAPVQE
jgi:hypothetical protein